MHTQDIVPLIGRGRLDICDMRDAGIVNEYIQPSERLDRRFNQPGPGRFVFDVLCKEDRLALALIGNASALLLVDIRQNEICALL